MGISVIISVLAYFISFFSGFYSLVPLILLLALVVDIFLLYAPKHKLELKRILPQKFSNGDENPVSISIAHSYPFEISLEVIDELPVQFQIRDFKISRKLKPHSREILSFSLRPTLRGEYIFGKIHGFVSSPIGLIKRRVSFDGEIKIAVYPSFIQMKKFQLYAVSNELTTLGIKNKTGWAYL